MDEDRLLRKLASAGRADEPPAIDVKAAVVAAVAAAREPSSVPLWVFAGAAAAAAVVMVVLGQVISAGAADAFGDFVQSMMAVSL